MNANSLNKLMYDKSDGNSVNDAAGGGVKGVFGETARAPGSDETLASAARSQPGTTGHIAPAPRQITGNLVIWAIINDLYEQFCQARLQEMQGLH